MAGHSKLTPEQWETIIRPMWEDVNNFSVAETAWRAAVEHQLPAMTPQAIGAHAKKAGWTYRYLPVRKGTDHATAES